MMKSVRWGFLGAGFVASRAVAPAVSAADGSVLQVVAARDVARAGELGPIRTEASYQAVCEAEDVDVVYLSLPNDAHRAWVITALEAGKHVLCEKPLGCSAADVREMSAAAERTGRLLVEAAWNRWHPRTRRLEALLANSDGPCEAEAWFTFAGVPAGNYRLDPGRGGGALLDVGCYAVAAALMALRDSVQVSEVDRRVGPTGVDLTTSATLTSSLGRARVRASFEMPESQGLRVVAPDLVVEVPHPAYTSWREPSELRVIDAGDERVERFAACDAYQVMIEAVAAQARGDHGWVLPVTTSLAVAEVLDAIAAS